MRQRPLLSRTLAENEFRRRCWLRAELVEAYRRLRVSPKGCKVEFTARMHAALSGAALSGIDPRRIRVKMPSRLALETRIGEGWSCNPGPLSRGRAARRREAAVASAAGVLPTRSVIITAATGRHARMEFWRPGISGGPDRSAGGIERQSIVNPVGTGMLITDRSRSMACPPLEVARPLYSGWQE